MKADVLTDNRKALFALLLCSGFIAGHPLAAFAAEGEASAQGIGSSHATDNRSKRCSERCFRNAGYRRQCFGTRYSE